MPKKWLYYRHPREKKIINCNMTVGLLVFMAPTFTNFTLNLPPGCAHAIVPSKWMRLLDWALRSLDYTVLVGLMSSSAWRTRRPDGPCSEAGRPRTSAVGLRRQRRGRRRRSTASGRQRSERTSTSRWTSYAGASAAAAWRTTAPCWPASETSTRRQNRHPAKNATRHKSAPFFSQYG